MQHAHEKPHKQKQQEKEQQRRNSHLNLDHSHQGGVRQGVAFLALGSLGDCLPLCALAARLKEIPQERQRHEPDEEDDGRRDSYSIDRGDDAEDRDGDHEPITALNGGTTSGRGSIRTNQQKDTHRTTPQAISDEACSVPGENADDQIPERDHDGAINVWKRKGKRKQPDVVDERKISKFPGTAVRLHGSDQVPSTRIGSREFQSTAAVVVTHGCHCDLLRSLMKDTFDVTEPPEVCPVDLPVLFQFRHTQHEPAKAGATSKTAITPQHEDQREAKTGEPGSTEACITEAEAERRACEELDTCMALLELLRPKALVFNLYSAFGFHLAQALKIPYACASPGVAPSVGSVPLRRLIPRAMLDCLDSAAELSSNEITRADLELWMLPLFLPRYLRWRLSRGLRAFPFPTLPKAPHVLFGVSATVLPRPGYWPAKADVCGFWSFSRLSPRYRPPDGLSRFLEKCENQQKLIFCVGLGSMPALGLVQSPDQVVSMAVSCLRRAGVAVVLLPTPASVPHAKHDAGEEEGAARTRSAPIKEDEHDEFVLDLTDVGFVPHQWLLPRCSGLLHHGGSGTTGAALGAGAVQVIIPLAYDQFFFADQMEHMGVGARVHGTAPSLSPERCSAREGGITPEGLTQAIAGVLGDEVRASAVRYRKHVEEEHGMTTACLAIASLLK